MCWRGKRRVRGGEERELKGREGREISVIRGDREGKGREGKGRCVEMGVIKEGMVGMGTWC